MILHQVVVFAIFLRLKAFWMLLPLVGAARAAREVGLSRFRGAHASQKTGLDITGYNSFFFKDEQIILKWIFLVFFWFLWRLEFCIFSEKKINHQHHLYSSSKFRAFFFNTDFCFGHKNILQGAIWLGFGNSGLRTSTVAADESQQPAVTWRMIFFGGDWEEEAKNQM